MKLRIACFVIWNSLLVVAVVILMRSCFAPDPVIITREEIKYNTIYKDVYKMPPEELQQALECYYTNVPSLDIEQINNTDEYTLKAGLCDRKWSRKIQIRPRDSPRNIFIAGPVVILNCVGAGVQYYRMWGNFGFGGGAAFSRDGPFIQAGVVYMR